MSPGAFRGAEEGSVGTEGGMRGRRRLEKRQRPTGGSAGPAGLGGDLGTPVLQPLPTGASKTLNICVSETGL